MRWTVKRILRIYRLGELSYGIARSLNGTGVLLTTNIELPRGSLPFGPLVMP